MALLEDVLMDHRNHNLDTQSSSNFRQWVSYKSTSENWSPENQMVSFFVIHWHFTRQTISSFYPKCSDHAGTHHMVGKNNCLLEVTVSVTSDLVRPKNHFVCCSAPHENIQTCQQLPLCLWVFHLCQEGMSTLPMPSLRQWWWLCVLGWAPMVLKMACPLSCYAVSCKTCKPSIIETSDWHQSLSHFQQEDRQERFKGPHNLRLASKKWSKMTKSITH